MAYSNLTGTHVTGQTGESQATANISPEVYDQALTTLLFEIVNCVIQCIRKSHPNGARKISDLEKPNALPNVRVNRAFRLDDRRALLRAFSLGNFDHNLLRTLRAKLPDL